MNKLSLVTLVFWLIYVSMAYCAAEIFFMLGITHDVTGTAFGIIVGVALYNVIRMNVLAQYPELFK